MLIRPFPLLWLLVLSTLARGTLAMTIVPPRNYAELAREADAVALAIAGETTVRKRGTLIFSDTRFTVIDSVRGRIAAGDVIMVRTPGGEIDGEFWFVSGAPRFEKDATYLLPLSRADALREDEADDAAGEDGAWLPTMFSYGVFRETVARGGLSVLLPIDEGTHGALRRPDGAAAEPLVPCETDALLDHLRDVLAERDNWSVLKVRADSSEVLESEGGGAGVPVGCAFFSSGTRERRWDVFDDGGWATIYSNPGGDPSLRDGGFWIVQEAMDLWMNISGTSFNLVFGGTRDVTPSCTGGQDSVRNFILFDDPCSDIANLSGCSGVLAYGGPRGSGTHTAPGDGQSWSSVNGWIVVVNNGTGCLGTSGYRIMLAHELGHGLGFGHVGDSGALMYASCCRNVNSTDEECSRFAYPALDPDQARPRAFAGSDRDVDLVSNTIRLTGSVSDDGLPGGPLDVTWAKLAGPGSVSFGDPSSPVTTASFSASGKYLLGLRVHDGALLDVDQVEVDVEVFLGTQERVSFQQGVDGYDGTIDTYILENDPDLDLSADNELEVDGDDPRDSGLGSHGLLRFEGIFGSQSGRIPTSTAIHRAWIELETTNTGDGAAVHRMRRSWDASDPWSAYGGDGIVAGAEMFAVRDALAPGVGEPAIVDVTTSIEEWARDPASNFGWGFVPLGVDGWDFYSSDGLVPPKLVVEFPVFEQSRLIELGDRWQIFRGSRAPPPDWNSPGLEPDDAWFSGATGIGYGDGDDTTLLPDMEDGYLTIYCRREFVVENAGVVGRLDFTIDYDDGFIGYINGVEVARSANMGEPGSPVHRNTAASPGREAGVFETYTLDPGALRTGTNILAVEIHNSTLGSSDMSFRPELSAELLLVPGGSEWKLLPGDNPVPARWSSVGFDDSSWESAVTGIGYGDGDDITELTDMEGAYVSIFCRKSFELECPGTVEAMRMTVIYDDGFVAYLNGEEIGRANMPVGPALFDTEASSSLEPQSVSFDVPASLLRAGSNVLSVSVHNSAIDSSDLTFMAVLVPFLTPAGENGCDGELPARFRRGDAGNDGAVDVSDAVTLLFSLFMVGDSPLCADAGDIDDDGELTVTDPVSLLMFLFQGGAAPPFPGILCGEDLTEDELEDCSAGGCEG